MATIRKADVDNHIMDSVLAPSMRVLHENLVLAKLVRNVSGFAQGAGKSDTIKFPKRGAVSTASKVAGTASTPVRFSDNLEATLVLDQHEHVNMVFEDGGTVFAQAGMKEGYMVDSAMKLAEKVDAALFALYTAAATAVGTAGSGLDKATLTSIRREARLNNWVSNLPIYHIVGAYGEEDLLNEALIVNRNTQTPVSDDAFINASLGRIFGIDHYASSLVPTVSGTPAREIGIAFQSDALALAFADMNLIASDIRGAESTAYTLTDDDGVPVYSLRATQGYSLNDLGSQIVVDTIFGVACPSPAQLIRVNA